MKADDIRDSFLNFFRDKGHRIYPSDSLVPAKDPTLLFTGAGMNQFKEEFLGRVRDTRRAATCQKCIRTGDLDNVGRTPSHHTFFEMLGNFSFGDYFKKEAVEWAWEFLTDKLSMNPDDLWVSVYKDDPEAYGIWKNIIKLPEKKIIKMGEEDNFWPASAPSKGPNGPCGPCSEIYYGDPDLGGVEVWNLVFTQFDRKEGGRLDPLPAKNIDTGMGLERITRVLQGKSTNFEIDNFIPIVEAVKSYMNKSAYDTGKISAIADHIRAVTFAIGDGVLPSNEERGYVIRKLIRRAFHFGRAMGCEEGPFLYRIVPVVTRVMKKPYPDLNKRREDIAQVVLSEEKRFSDTLESGMQKLRELIDKAGPSGTLRGEDVFRLYDTYGFPPELTKEIAETENAEIDVEGFERRMEEQRAKSREKTRIKDAIFPVEELDVKLPAQTPFIDDKEEIETEVLLVSPVSRAEARVFLRETNFYGEKGGQQGDRGVLIKDGREAAIVTDAADVAGRTLHKVRITEKGLNKGDKVVARVDITRRNDIKKNHTATHLLHFALRKVLGPHVKQAGSLVAPDRLRFDFNHFKAMSPEEMSRVEDIVNGIINTGEEVQARDMSIEEAKKQGAVALFGEKYGDTVRMVRAGDDSKELCGGTHVSNTSEIKAFKILSESSIAGGVRRIEAVTGSNAYREIKKRNEVIRGVAGDMGVTPENILPGIENATGKLRELGKKLDELGAKKSRTSVRGMLKNKKTVNGFDLVVGEVKNADMDLLRKNSDTLKSAITKGIFFLASKKDDKAFFTLGIKGTDELKAPDLLNKIGAEFGVKGGGRPDFAQAGGRLPDTDIGIIIKKAEKVIKESL